jgi:hypothetical protein
MAMRSGRFKSARTIIKGRTNTFFRILNSAEFNNTNANINAITITFGAGMENSAVLLPTFSLDFCARGEVAVAGTGTIEGIYDALPNPDVKNGRFKTKQPMDPTAGLKIITPGGGNTRAIYRIFNTGPTSIQLVAQNHDGTGTANLDAPIPENESFDFVTPLNKVILVKGTGTAMDHIEGIYDFIAEV